MHLCRRSSLASHDRQRSEKEVQPERFAVDSLDKPCGLWLEWTARRRCCSEVAVLVGPAVARSERVKKGRDLV